MSEEEIIKLARQYKVIKSCEIKGKSCYIITQAGNEFYFDTDEITKGNIKLYHKNSKACKKYHVQNNFYDVPFLLRSIATHEIYKFKSGKSKMEKLFDIVELEMYNKSKLNKKKIKNRNIS